MITLRTYAAEMRQQVLDADKATYSKAEVSKILWKISDTTELNDGLIGVQAMKRGDVFISKMVGGKVRPWVVLSSREGLVVAVAMSSGDSAPRMVKSQARYWPGQWIGTTVSLFREEDAAKTVTRPYNNLRHLRDVERQLAKLFGLRK